MEIAASDRIAAYDSGTADAGELNAKLPQAWTRTLADPARRARVAAALGVDEATLATLGTPPVRIAAGRAFIDAGAAATLVATWIVSDVLLAALKDVAKDEVKRRIRQVWALIEPELRGLFDQRNALGPLSRDEGDDTRQRQA